MTIRGSYFFFLFFFLMIRRPPRSTLFPLHDALPISTVDATSPRLEACLRTRRGAMQFRAVLGRAPNRSEEHTSELQSQSNLVCRLLLEKKKKKKNKT